MVDVVANERGYFGGLLREPGDRFSIPEGRMPSWVSLANGAAKADKADEAKQPEAKAKRGRKPKSDPFEDAPEPVSLAGAQKAAGGIEPDWIPPEHQAPKPVDD